MDACKLAAWLESIQDLRVPRIYRPAQEIAYFNSSGTPGRPFLVRCKPLLTRTRPTLSSNRVILKECLKKKRFNSFT